MFAVIGLGNNYIFSEQDNHLKRQLAKKGGGGGGGGSAAAPKEINGDSGSTTDGAELDKSAKDY